MNKSNKVLAYEIFITSLAPFLIVYFIIINLSNAASHAVVVDSNSLTTLYIGVFILPESLVLLILTAPVLTTLKKIAKNYFKFRLYLILFLVSFILVGIYLTILIQWHPPILVPTQFAQSYTYSLYAALIISILSYGSSLIGIEAAIIAITIGNKYNLLPE